MKKINRILVSLFVALLVIINFSSFTLHEEKAKRCTGVIHVLNNTSNETITHLTLIDGAGSHGFSVSIPPHGSYDPNFGVNTGGSETIIATVTPSSTGTI